MSAPTNGADPRVVERPEQPYAGITSRVTMNTMNEIADRMPEIFARLAERGVAPASAPFFRYHVIDMERELEVEVGVPVAAPVTDDPVTDSGPIRAGVLPAGKYVTLTHVGHPDQLVEVTARLLAWAADRDLVFDVEKTERGDRWGSRLEIWHTNPAEEPDPAKWETELAFRLA
ncbi:GyrI-like domain-containing protein [Actinopolymorpha rutila]|uniref:DNA gyrase inhibitor GyrI n=1 Tax=Actinopolymorpha rutila TaxID=446787 RepID=A0A852Z6R3_9ACTN|nr:GyrI-like domain-containing protein [Actinopolymorpha rutila]NYH88977.1 DNA gyrase inhibitor GyrI [Actinopolymorpha rutila]